MDDMEKLKEMVAKEIEMLAKIEEAVTGAQGNPDAPEMIAQKLGLKLGEKLDPITPLADTMEDADAEFETQILSRSQKLGEMIETKLGQILKDI